MQSCCWYFQKIWGSAVEKAKWLWAKWLWAQFVMWSEGASLILFILINLYVSVCSRHRMSTTIIKRYTSLAFEWNPFVVVGSPSAGSECTHEQRGVLNRVMQNLFYCCWNPNSCQSWTCDLHLFKWSLSVVGDLPKSSPVNSPWTASYISIQLLGVFPIPSDNRGRANSAIWMVMEAY